MSSLQPQQDPNNTNPEIAQANNQQPGNQNIDTSNKALNLDEIPGGTNKIKNKETDDEQLIQIIQPPKTKKIPSRFADKMMKAAQKKQKKSPQASIQLGSPPKINLDEMPVEKNNTQVREFTQTQPEQKKKKKPAPTKKLAEKPVKTENPPPIPIDDIPIGGNAGPTQMKGQFDQVPIGKKTTFDISEFAEGGQEPIETNYTMEQKLKSKAVKLRQSGMEELLVMIENDGENPALQSIDMKSLLKQNNPACLEKIMLCCKMWVKTKKLWGDDQVKGVIENGYINGKNNAKVVAMEIIDEMYDEYPDHVEVTILTGLQGKIPKNLAGYLAVTRQLLTIYGISRMNHMKPYFNKIVTILNKEKLIQVKTEGINLLKQTMKWLTKPIVDPLIKDLKDALKKQLDTFWESYDKQQIMKAPKDIQEQENTGKPKKKIDAYDLSQAIDIFKKYNQKWSEKVLNEEKWSEKVKMMQEFINDANVPKIKHDSQYRHINEMVKRLINHSNFNVVLMDLKIMATLARGLRRNFFQTAKTNFNSVISKFRDKKTQMVEETFATLNQFTHCLSIEQVVDQVREGLADKAPNMKVNLLNWIGKYIEKKIQEKGQLPEKSQQAIIMLFPTFQKLMSDGVADVRDTMAKNIGKMKLMMGEEFFDPMNKKMSKDQVSKANEAKKNVPKSLSKEKRQKKQKQSQGDNKAPSQISKKGKNTPDKKSQIVATGSMNDQILQFMPKMNHSDWQKRKQSAEAIIEIFRQNQQKVVKLSCLNDLLNILKTRIADPNKNIIKFFVQLTAYVFEVMPEKEVKAHAKNFMSQLIEGLSDKVQANRVEICLTLNKIGEIYGKTHLLTTLGPYLYSDKDSRVQIINLILENQEFIQKADTKQYPKGIIRGLTDKNKQIRSLSEKLFQKIHEKMGLEVFKTLAKNQRPAILKDLNNFFGRFEGKTKTNTSSVISKGAPPTNKPPTLVSSKKNSQVNSMKGSQRSFSRSSRQVSEKDLDIEDCPAPGPYKDVKYFTHQGGFSFGNQSIQKNLVDQNEYFAAIGILQNERIQREKRNQKNPWLCDIILQNQEDQLTNAIKMLFKADMSKKMFLHDHRKVIEIAGTLIKMCKQLQHQNQIRQVYDLILKWVFLRLWGGNPALQSLIQVLPPVMSILEKKKVMLSEYDTDIIMGIMRQYFITGYMNNYKVSASLYIITKYLIALTSGDRVLKIFLTQFNIDLSQLHRHVGEQGTPFYYDGLRNLIKSQLMEYIGNGNNLQLISKIPQLKMDKQLLILLNQRVHHTVLGNLGFQIVKQSQVQEKNHDTQYGSPNIIAKKAAPRQFILKAGKSTQMDLSKYPRPPYMSSLAKELKKLLPPREGTITYFMNMLDEKNTAASSQIKSYGHLIFGSILQSVQKMMNNREAYAPDKILTQINLLQQAIKFKPLMDQVQDMQTYAIQITMMQLVSEDQNKNQINKNLEERGVAIRAEQFIKAINGVLLRIIQKGNHQITINSLLFMLNHYGAIDPVDHRLISLIVKCLSKVNSQPLKQITDEGTVQFLIGSIENFSLVNVNFKIEQFNAPSNRKLYPQQQTFKNLKKILNDLAMHYGGQIWILYECALDFMNQSQNKIADFFKYLGLSYPNASVSCQNDDIKKINELISRQATYEKGINELRKYMQIYPEFQVQNHFKEMGCADILINNIMESLGMKRMRGSSVSKRQLRQSRSPRSRRSPDYQQNNLQDKLKNLKRKIEQDNSDATGNQSSALNTNSFSKKEEQENKELKRQDFLKRIQEIKNKAKARA